MNTILGGPYLGNRALVIQPLRPDYVQVNEGFVCHDTVISEFDTEERIWYVDREHMISYWWDL